MSPHPEDGSPGEPNARNDRQVYRAVYPLSYPVAAVPHVLLERATMPLPILDCSEQGLRYRAPVGEVELPLGTPVAGEVTDNDGGVYFIRGYIVRAEAGEVAIRLEPPGLPFTMLLAEQRAVIRWTRTRAEPGF